MIRPINSQFSSRHLTHGVRLIASVAIILTLQWNATAQIGINSTTPNAELDIVSSDDGILIPRVALSNSSTPTVLTPTESEIVYNTATSGDLTPGFYYWSGSGWVRFQTGPNVNWRLSGNSGTSAGDNFIGTTDNVPLSFRINNERSGRIGNATDGNTFLGYKAGISTDLNTYLKNTFIGYESGITNTNGEGNTAIGNWSFYYNTTGDFNTANGHWALAMNGTGNENTASGYMSLPSNTSGSFNTAMGSNALYGNVTGRWNTATGAYSLKENNSGEENTANGYMSLNKSYSGSYNTAMGAYSLSLNETGQNNTAVGRGALYRNKGASDNTAVGYWALFENLEGKNNTAIGREALRNNTNDFNTAAGYFALQGNTSGYNNTAHGAYALRINTSGIENTAVGREALDNVTTGSNNIGIGHRARVPSATGSNQVRIGNTSITYAGVQVAWTITSDREWKMDIQKSSLGLNFIQSLNPVSYVRKNDESGKKEYGFIAQEIQAALIESGVGETGIISQDDSGMYGVRYNDLFAPIVKSIQEQQVIIEQQDAQITRLMALLTTQQESLQQLTSEIEKLKKRK